VFSFITTTQNALVATVNHEIGLLLATEDDHEAWLNGSAEEVLAIVKPVLPG
jgi:putative SOS response-associated peptidase YedK